MQGPDSSSRKYFLEAKNPRRMGEKNLPDINLMRTDFQENHAVAMFFLTGSETQGYTFIPLSFDISKSRSLSPHVTSVAWRTMATWLAAWCHIASTRAKDIGNSVSWETDRESDFNINVERIQVNQNDVEVRFIAQPNDTLFPVRFSRPDSNTIVTYAWNQLSEWLHAWRTQAIEKRRDPQNHFNWTGSVDVPLGLVEVPRLESLTPEY